MMKKELSYFVNLNEFPIHDSDNSKYKKIVQEAREALTLDGCYVLKSIINMEAINEMQKEASKIENLAGLNNVSEIVEASDVIMIDRGDLAAEVGSHNLFEAIIKITNVSNQNFFQNQP